MYYKIIYENMIIDAIKKPQYVRWLKKSRQFAKTDPTSAHGIRSADGVNIYHVEDMPDFKGMENYKTVKMVEIDKDEYDGLMAMVIEKNPIVIYQDENELDDPEILKQRVAELQDEVKKLTECIIEMSSVLYS